MISDITLIFYVWVTILFFWYHNSVRLEKLKPPILLDKFFITLFEIIKIAWIALSIYVLFTSWTILIVPLIIWLATKYLPYKSYEKIENASLIPIMLMYSAKHWREIKNRIVVNKTKDKINVLKVLSYFFIFLSIISISELFLPIKMAIEQFQSGRMKPSWATGVILILLAEPYKNQVYIATIILGSICLVLGIYQKWFKKEK